MSKNGKLKALGFVLLVSATMLGFQNCDTSSLHEGDLLSLQSNEDLDIQAKALLAARCASCHGGGANFGNFGSIDSVDTMISQGWLVPGQPASSAIYNEIESGRMPTAGPFNAEQTQLIYDWIVSLNSNPANAIPFSDVNTNVFQPNCIACHGPSDNVPLDTYANVKAYVWPGFPEGSLVYDSPNRADRNEHVNVADAGELQLIYDWIKQGAVQ